MTLITLGPPQSAKCQRNLESIIETCKLMGTPLEKDKCKGPTSVLTFLGMELDSINMEIQLPMERLRRLLADWVGRKVGRKRELLSLIGSLQHASKAVQRCFLRRLITLSTDVKNMDNFVHLNVAMWQQDRISGGGQCSQLSGTGLPCSHVLTRQTATVS